MSAVGPVDHIPRLPLPWRDAADLTECGRALADVAGRTVTVAELQRRIAEQGKTRAAFTACMTCWETAARWRCDDPSRDALEAIAREIEAVRYVRHVPRERPVAPHPRLFAEWERMQRLVGEIEALAALIAAHRDEFDGYLAGRAAAADLAVARAHRARRGAR